MDPKWLIIQEILKSIGSKHAQKIASRLKIPDVRVFLDCMKIRTYSGLGSMSGDVVKQNNRTTSNRNFCKIGIISSISRI